MNSAMLHLAGAHFPIALVVVSFLLILAAMIGRSRARLRFALELVILGAVFSWGTLLTGERAEAIVENLPGLTDPDLRHHIHEHEEWATRAHYALQACAVLAVVTLLTGRRRQTFSILPAVVMLLATGATSALMGYTGRLGGEIRHTEVRENASLAPASPAEESPQSDDDDEG